MNTRSDGVLEGGCSHPGCTKQRRTGSATKNSCLTTLGSSRPTMSGRAVGVEKNLRRIFLLHWTPTIPPLKRRVRQDGSHLMGRLAFHGTFDITGGDSICEYRMALIESQSKTF